MNFFKFIALPAIFSSLTHAEEAQYDAVKAGKIVFESIGCAECHSVEKGDASLKSGPNLYGLFLTAPRDREVMVKDEKTTIKADRQYFESSIRKSWDQLAIHENGSTEGATYERLMPPYVKEVISDENLDSLWHYLRTLASGDEAGPAQVMRERVIGKAETALLKIPNEEVIGDSTRIVRAPIAGTSARALHVGQLNGISYSFDPRLLSIRRIWSGGFVNLNQERSSRAKNLSTLGKDAQIHLEGAAFLAPLTETGRVIDFEFKEPDAHDYAAIEKHLWDGKDFSEKLAEMEGNFLGYELSGESREPTFKFTVGENLISETIRINRDQTIQITLKGTLKTPQKFAITHQLVTDVQVSGGEIKTGTWTLPAGEGKEFVFTAKLRAKFAEKKQLTRQENLAPQELKISPAKPGNKPITLPQGYSLKDWAAPLDSFGRKQLFEPTGIAVAKDGTIVLATRAAGIWRIRNHQWSLFAEGIYEGLGVVIEDDKGDAIVIAQKPEITRITDVDGDGRADTFETLTDDYGFHGNYHEYTHGPVRDSEGNYYFLLNLSHDHNAPRVSWTAGGKFMGTMGGYRGWACRVTPEGKFETFAHGLRSPAGLGVAPDGRIWYTENQGEYVGSSKIVPLEKGKFYGHISGLVNLPGMVPNSEKLKNELWADKLRKGAVWLPHAIVANSPGSPVWDLTGGKFGPFSNQIFVGDQTLSQVVRVTTEQVGGVDQGAVMPFTSGLTSGIMRSVFLPDGSLLLGQTGRGWGALGGAQSGLQQVVYDGSSAVTDLETINITAKGFSLKLTEPLKADVTLDKLKAAVEVNSWFYSNFAAYGSPRRDKRPEVVSEITISSDRRLIEVSLLEFGKEGMGGLDPAKIPEPTRKVKSKHKRDGKRDWLDRVFHLKLNAASDFFKTAPATDVLEGYYTLRAIPAKN